MISSVSLKSTPSNTAYCIALLTTSIVATKMSFCVIEAVSPIFLTRLNISKSTNIQRYYRIFFKSSYFNFVSDSICVMSDFSIPLIPLKKIDNRREMCCLRVRILIDLKVETQGQSQALLGFVIYIKNYGGSSVSNPLTPLVGATPPYVLKSKHKES